MFNTKNLLALLFICTLFIGVSRAQAPAGTPNGVFQGTIEEQFDVLLKNSYPYDNFKSVRDQLPKFKKNTLDSILALEKQLSQQNDLIAAQNKSIDSLKISLEETKKLVSEEASISFLGVQLDKGTYHLFVWTIIVVLVIALLIALQRFRSNNRVAKESREAAEAIREEYEQHRKKAMEREQKLKRDLQDELNKSGR